LYEGTVDLKKALAVAAGEKKTRKPKAPSKSNPTRQ
jgi:hypothetical protein